MTAPAISTFAKVGIDTANPTTLGFEYVSADLRKRQRHAYSSGVRGTKSRQSTRARIAAEPVSGQIVLEPTATELDRLWPWVLGGNTAVGVTDVADTLTNAERFIQIDKVTKVYTYAGCRAGRFTLNATSGGIIRVSIDVEAETETVGNAGSFPAITPPGENVFVCSDIVLTVNSIPITFGAITLTVDNVLDGNRFFNSVSRVEIPSLDRLVTLSVQNAPFDTDVQPLYDVAVAGFAGTLVMTGNGVTYTFAFGNLKVPAEGPSVPTRSEITLPLEFHSFAVPGGASELKVTKT